MRPPLYFLALALALSVSADDMSRGVPLPGLRSETPGAAVTRATIHLHADRSATVTLRLAKPAELTLELPRFGWLGDGETYPDRHFPELRIAADGKPAKLQRDETRVFVGDKDITTAFQVTKLDPYVIAGGTPVIQGNAIAQLQPLGALRKDGDEHLAAWTVQRRLAFAAKREVRMEYKARPAFELRSANDLTSYGTKYCLAAAPQAGAFVATEYEIPISVNGGPVRGTVRIEVALPGRVVYCPNAGSDGMVRILQFEDSK